MTSKHNSFIIIASLIFTALLFFTPIINSEVEASSLSPSKIVEVAKKYQGVKYVYGGTTTSGFDCSGYVQYVYKELGISLPRTTGEMYNQGTYVAKSNLQVGDLIFFNANKNGKVSHVGIYIGSGQFAHASSSQGVMVSAVNDPYYWGSRYVGAKRVANVASTVSTVSASKGWVNQGSEWYYYQNGSAKKGWLQDGNKWYYTNQSGVMQTGWKLINNKWYHLNVSGEMSTGWNKVSGKWYYHDTSGAMKTGWIKVSNKWYYHDTSGAMKTGWSKVSSKWYYHNTSGTMLTGWITVSNVKYFMYDNGDMAANTIIDGYQLAANGALLQ